MFAMINIKYHFTCGEWKLYLNGEKFQNIMSKTVNYASIVYYKPVEPF